MDETREEIGQDAYDTGYNDGLKDGCRAHENLMPTEKICPECRGLGYRYIPLEDIRVPELWWLQGLDLLKLSLLKIRKNKYKLIRKLRIMYQCQ